MAIGGKFLGLYVHVPFCSSTCDFCAFYQEKPRKEDIKRYLEGVRRELEEHYDISGGVDTVFWGGGTPGLLAGEDLRELGEVVRGAVGGSKIKEWTVEMAPSAVKLEKLKVLKEMGVTRISMGVQSFNKDLLEALGRQHTLKQIYQGYEWIREVGFESVNLDLIFAIPGQSEEMVREDLEELSRLNPEHASLYCLTFEEDTAMYIKLSQGKVKRDEERERGMYRYAWELLEERGYGQYEVSNFGKEGHECLHNVNTWRMNWWVGVGPSGSSQYNYKRYTNIPSLKEWLEGIEEGRLRQVDCKELTEGELWVDRLVFGLRMNEGVEIGNGEWVRDEGMRGRWGEFRERLVREGYAWERGGRLGLTVEGRLVVDRIGVGIIDIFS